MKNTMVPRSFRAQFLVNGLKNVDHGCSELQVLNFLDFLQFSKKKSFILSHLGI